LLDKQRPRIRAPQPPPHGRPQREQAIQAITHDPTYVAQYPRAARGANRADPYFSPRSGTRLNQITPSYGVGETGRYGRGDVHNIGSLGDAGVPGSHLDVAGRYRQGERPLPERSSRRMPPYGTRSNVTRVIPVADRIEQESQTSQNAHRKPALRGVLTQPRSRRPPSRRQGYMKQTGANIQGSLHATRYLGDEARRRRKKRKVAELMAKRTELTVVRDTLRKEQTVRQALAQADAALESIDNKFVKGFHSDGSLFRIWEKAIELTKQEQAGVTMKGLR
jgi:hypothetical protein